MKPTEDATLSKFMNAYFTILLKLSYHYSCLAQCKQQQYVPITST